MKKLPVVVIERPFDPGNDALIKEPNYRIVGYINGPDLRRLTGLRLKPGQSTRCRIRIEKVRGK